MHSCDRLLIHADVPLPYYELYEHNSAEVWCQDSRGTVLKQWQSLGIIQNHSLYSKITSKIQIKVRKVIGMLNLLYLLHLKTKNCTEDTKDQVINWWTIWYSLFGPKYMGATPLPVNKFQAQRITVLTHGGYIRVGQSISYRNLQCHEA